MPKESDGKLKSTSKVKKKEITKQPPPPKKIKNTGNDHCELMKAAGLQKTICMYFISEVIACSFKFHLYQFEFKYAIYDHSPLAKRFATSFNRKPILFCLTHGLIFNSLLRNAHSSYWEMWLIQEI